MQLRKWRIEGGDPVGDPEHFIDPDHARVFSRGKGGELLFSVRVEKGDPRLRIFNTETWAELFSVAEPPEKEAHSRLDHALNGSPDLAVIGYHGGRCCLVRLDDGKLLADLSVHGGRLVSGVIFTPDGRRLVTVGWDGRVVIRELETLIGK